MSNTEEAVILVDAHVHIYDCFDIEILLDAASHNFINAAKKLGLEGGLTGVLLLSETSQDHWFQRLTTTDVGCEWQIKKTQDKTVLQAIPLNNGRDYGATIYLMAGRQIITAEGLELLALATDSEFKDGLPVSVTLSAVREKNAIPVLPWAVGKWLGRRGKLVTSLLKTEACSDLCLGDNSGRPIFWRNPAHFQQAKKNGIPLLPGTDPLPIATEAVRVGSFGFAINGRLSELHPSGDLKQIIRNNAMKLIAYGPLENPLRFFSNQFRLRV